ncbi:SDR family NAD(P)-dependent oxidoreductase [Rhodococcus sp. SGAir0479]|uniref:SDR family NAD(P)-dependent oxidoreductase n=1 Tax=Rhodococcus sp. SGAir0479 TaxID=2567884 RepID=UPI0010CD6B6D|nr:SDR family NAD(P)-dependent oxidoreductase [Rhodococcus sp. SGAir0479]QCQ93322.1 SDR family NAD(P)-dependent oxidoreductase [Rhodococcus sp. SGAir0479]
MTTRPPLALVTGASSGIGLELAKLFVGDGYDVIVVAEQPQLETVAAELESTGGAVHPVVADLRTATGVQEVGRALEADGRPLAAAALNAGIGHGGTFVDTDVAVLLDIIDLNVRGTVHLAKIVFDAMAREGAGKVLITSSVASTLPGPYQTVYNASKSFLQSFSDGLQAELTGTGITLTSLMPGATATDFFRRARLEDSVMGRMPKDDPAAVARAGYDAMQQGKRKVVAASLMSKGLAAAGAVLPVSVKAAAHKVLAKPRRSH